MRRLVLSFVLVCLGISSVAAQESVQSKNEFELSNRFMPTARRIDREINKNVFAYKGEVALGLTIAISSLCWSTLICRAR